METESGATSNSAPITVHLYHKEEQRLPQKKPLISAAGLDFIKWIIGSIIIGMFSTLITFKHAEKELQLKQLETDSKFIAAINEKFDPLDDGSVKELKYYKYILPFITSDTIRERIKEKIGSIEYSNRLALVQKDSIRLKVAADSIEHKLYTEKFRTISKEGKPITDLVKDESAIINQIIAKNSNAGKDFTPKTGDSTEKYAGKIFEINQQLEPVKKSGFITLGSEQKWFKEGYFLTFNNTIKILLDAINEGAITVTIEEMQKQFSGNSKSKIVITTEKATQVQLGDYTYNISLDLIGRAGRNPFTKAAYITVTTLKKE